MTEPATQYVVSVRAFNDVDKGPVIYDLVYTATGQGTTSAYSDTYLLSCRKQLDNMSNTAQFAGCVNVTQQLK